MCLRLERILGQEVSKRVTLNNIVSDLRFQLQETFVLLEAAEGGNVNKERGLADARKEIDYLNSMLEGAFEKEMPVRPQDSLHSTFTDRLQAKPASPCMPSQSSSEESSDDGTLPALPLMPLKRKAEQLPLMGAPSPKRPFRRILLKSPALISPRAASPVTPIAMSNYSYHNW